MAPGEISLYVCEVFFFFFVPLVWVRSVVMHIFVCMCLLMTL